MNNMNLQSMPNYMAISGDIMYKSIKGIDDRIEIYFEDCQ